MKILLISLVISVSLILVLRGLAYKLNIVDQPGGRKQHEHPTPSVGGLAMFAATLAAMVLTHTLNADLQMLMEFASLLMVLGLLDDMYELSASVRMMAQVFLAASVIISADGEVSHLGALFNGDIQLGIFAIPFTVVAYVGGINAINMIDGADGMAGKMLLISTVGVTILFLLAGFTRHLPLTCAMTGALAGFLFLNSRIFVKRALVFMGDAGSMWLGLAIGWLMAQVTQEEVAAQPAVVLWLFGIPLIDTLVVMFRRIQRRQSPFKADRTHIHHLLEAQGMSVKQSVLLLSVIQTGLVGAGVFFYLLHVPSYIVFWSFIALFTAYYLRVRNYGLADDGLHAQN